MTRFGLRMEMVEPAEDPGVAAADILVVDDEADVLDTMVAMLESAGHDVSFASHSDEVRPLLDALAFDVIVSDVMMPAPDGLELLEIARRKNPHVQVLLVSGFGTRDLAMEAWRKGACGFLEKPFSIEQLTQAVRHALRRAQLRSAEV